MSRLSHLRKVATCKHISGVVGVMLLAILVMTAPVAGAHIAVASIHTTDSDFNSASTLSDVTIQGTGQSASVDLKGLSGRTVTRPADDENWGTSSKAGLYINPNRDISGVNVTVSSMTSGATTAYLRDGTTVLDQVSISSGVANLSASLTAGTTYNVVLDAGGNSWTVGDYSASSYPYTSNQIDITGAIDPSGSNNAIAIKSVTVRNKKHDDGTYIGAVHTVDNAKEGFTELALDQSNATVTWQGSSGSGWTTVDTTEYATSGNKTATLPETYDDYRVNVTFTKTGHNPVGQLEAEGVRADAAEPVLDNTSASPSGGERISSAPTYEINGTDADFATVQGDQITLTWYRNGNQLGTTTETANGTWSFSPNEAIGGENTWHVTASDEYGHSASSDTFRYESPERLAIKNETAPSQYIKGSDVDVTVTFYGDSTVVERSTSDGNVSLAGLPADESFVATVQTEGYHNRRIYIDSLFEQQSVYLLNKTTSTSVSVDFKLDDSTGQFSGNGAVIRVQRALNESGTVQYQTIVGDEIGANEELAATLAKDKRYRLIITNQNGDRRVLGSYIASDTGTEVIPIGKLTIEADDATGYSMETRMVKNGSTDYIRIAYRDTAENTTDLQLAIYKINSTGNYTIRPPTNESGPFGTYSELVKANQSNATYKVNWHGFRGGDGGSGTITLGRGERFFDKIPIDSYWLQLIGYVGLAALAGLVVISKPRLGSVAIVAIATIFTWIGVLPLAYWQLGPAAAAAVFFAVGGDSYR